MARMRGILHNADADYHKAIEFLRRGKVGPTEAPFCPICDAIDGEVRQDNATLRTRIAELEAELRNFAENFDCDMDAHRLGTHCRACRAKALLGEGK